jgi:hypothetical protein
MYYACDAFSLFYMRFALSNQREEVIIGHATNGITGTNSKIVSVCRYLCIKNHEDSQGPTSLLVCALRCPSRLGSTSPMPAVVTSFQTFMHVATMRHIWQVPPTKAASGHGSSYGRVDTAKAQLPDRPNILILISGRNRVDMSSGSLQPDFTYRSTTLRSKSTCREDTFLIFNYFLSLTNSINGTHHERPFRF